MNISTVSHNLEHPIPISYWTGLTHRGLLFGFSWARIAHLVPIEMPAAKARHETLFGQCMAAGLPFVPLPPSPDPIFLIAVHVTSFN